MKISKVIYLDSYAAFKGIGKEEGAEFLKTFGVEIRQYGSGVGEVLL